MVLACIGQHKASLKIILVNELKRQSSYNNTNINRCSYGAFHVLVTTEKEGNFCETGDIFKRYLYQLPSL